MLLSSLAYHILHLVLVRRDRAVLRHMVPQLRDVQDLGEMFLYNLGLSKAPPTFGKFNYVEKIEYIAFRVGHGRYGGERIPALVQLFRAAAFS